jgi:hypothetical protein
MESLELGVDEEVNQLLERDQRLTDPVELVRTLREVGARVMGYGASTKGNVLLQFCGFTSADIEAIAEVNADKFGHFTPGSAIPIIPEAEMREARPDFLLVFPWQFSRRDRRARAGVPPNRRVPDLPAARDRDRRCLSAAASTNHGRRAAPLSLGASR